MRHSEIPDTMYIKLDFLRDYKNCLKLISKVDHLEYVDLLESDPTRFSARLATKSLC